MLAGVGGRWWARALACQRTLRGPVRLTGVALHSGADAVAEVLPAPPGTGVVFRVPGRGGHCTDIPADLAHAGESPRSTSLVEDDHRVDTVEHFLAALYGMGIDNALVVVSGGEPPVLDGSCQPLVDAISQVGVEESPARRRELRLSRPVYVSAGSSHAMAVPGEGLRLSVGTEFRRPVGRSAVDLVLDPESFRSELAAARTPGFVDEWKALKRAGLALGASEENVLVVLEDGYGVPPRWPDEVGRHKTLDLVGDLALLGARLHACVTTVMGGHALNRALVREIQGTVSLVE